MFDDGADFVVDVKADHDQVMRSDADGNDGERCSADDARSGHRTALLERDRIKHSQAAFNGELKDEAGRVVGKQVAEVLLQDAEELAVVDEVEMGVREEPTASGRQEPTEQDADQVDRVGDGQGEQVDVGRHLAHLVRRKHEHAQRVADETGRHERQ